MPEATDQATANVVALGSLAKGDGVELHSEQEAFRATMAARTPENERATLIVTRRKQRVWVTFDGALRTTVAMTYTETTRLVDLLHEAQGIDQ